MRAGLGCRSAPLTFFVLKLMVLRAGCLRRQVPHFRTSALPHGCPVFRSVALPTHLSLPWCGSPSLAPSVRPSVRRSVHRSVTRSLGPSVLHSVSRLVRRSFLPQPVPPTSPVDLAPATPEFGHMGDKLKKSFAVLAAAALAVMLAGPAQAAPAEGGSCPTPGKSVKSGKMTVLQCVPVTSGNAWVKTTPTPKTIGPAMTQFDTWKASLGLDSLADIAATVEGAQSVQDLLTVAQQGRDAAAQAVADTSAATAAKKAEVDALPAQIQSALASYNTANAKAARSACSACWGWLERDGPSPARLNSFTLSGTVTG